MMWSTRRGQRTCHRGVKLFICCRRQRRRMSPTMLDICTAIEDILA